MRRTGEEVETGDGHGAAGRAEGEVLRAGRRAGEGEGDPRRGALQDEHDGDEVRPKPGPQVRASVVVVSGGETPRPPAAPHPPSSRLVAELTPSPLALFAFATLRRALSFSVSFSVSLSLSRRLLATFTAT